MEDIFKDLDKQKIIELKNILNSFTFKTSTSKNQNIQILKNFFKDFIQALSNSQKKIEQSFGPQSFLQWDSLKVYSIFCTTWFSPKALTNYISAIIFKASIKINHLENKDFNLSLEPQYFAIKKLFQPYTSPFDNSINFEYVANISPTICELGFEIIVRG